MSHVFFSKDVMDEPACTAVEMTFRPCLHTGRWMIWRWKRYGVGRNIQQSQTNLVCVQGNLTGQRYRDVILQQHILNVIDRQREIFQQDNARLHTARETMDFLTQNNINVLPWSSMSPDLNPQSLKRTS